MEERRVYGSVAPVLRVEGLVKTYGPLRALDGVTFSAGAGSLVALVGPNGAGKTTTLKCVLGLLRFQGHIEVDGLLAARESKEVRRRIGYLPQASAFRSGDTCREALEFLADLRGSDRRLVCSLLDLVNLAEQRNTRVGHLSGGMRQRLAVAAALLSDPALLLLDEPTANLDVESRHELHKLLARLKLQGKAIVVSTHFLDHLSDLTDRIVVLNSGRVVFDGTREEMIRRAPAGRFVVRLNGDSPAALLDALRSVGIGPERLEPADAGWEELLLPALQADSAPGGEAGEASWVP